MRFQNKVVIVTGGSSGIGAATAYEFQKEGAIVYILDRALPHSKINEHFIKCDVRNFSEVKTALDSIVTKKNKVDCLVANAGIHYVGSIEDTDLETFEEVVSVNFKGIFYSLKCVLPIMREQRHGSIVLMGSDQSLIGKKKSAIYGATKGAIGQLTKSTALDYAEYGIRVNCVCPGAIDTPLCEGAIKNFTTKYTTESVESLLQKVQEKHPLNRLGKPEEVANVILFVCSNEASFITGSLISIDGGYVAQ